MTNHKHTAALDPYGSAIYKLPCTLSNVLDLCVIHEGAVRTIGSLNAKEFHLFVVNCVRHGGTLNSVLEGISREYDTWERWYVLVELGRLGKSKGPMKNCLKLYDTQEEAERALKAGQEQVA